MPHHNPEIQLSETEARRLLLAQALDEADAQGRLVGAAEREEVDRAALAATGDPVQGQVFHPQAFLLDRARRLLELLAHRQPSVAALQDRPAWQSLLAWALPAAALLAGAVIDRVDNPHQVNLLSPPLLAFLLWNLGVYLLLLVLALRPPAPSARRAFALPLPGRPRGPAAQAFARLWSRAGGALEGQRWRRILHLSAACWGIGVALSIVLGGIVREYRVGWESTLLDVPQVHAFLRALFAPVFALLPVQGFSVDEVARLHFGSGADVGRAQARRWVGLYVALIALVVVLPRLLLAGWAALRERRLAATVRIDLSQPYYEALLGRVQPARLRLGLLPPSAQAGAVLGTILRQAADGGPPTAPQLPWTLLATARGDELLLLREPTVPAAPAASQAPVPLAWWSRWRPAAGAAVAAGPAAAHILLLAADRPAELENLLPALRAAGRPLVVLAADGAEAAWQALLQGLGAPAQVLSLHALPNWTADTRLLEAIAGVLPPYRQGGLQRLRGAWEERARARFTASMRLLAQELFDAAADSEPLGPQGLRQVVVPAEREAGREAREQARARLLERFHERRQATDTRLLEWHGAASGAPGPEGLAIAWRPQQQVDARQAGLAGAASGAAMGATLDLMTGVMSLGAASALGGLIGGGAAFVAAAWRNTAGQGTGQAVAMSEEMLLDVAELALLRYLGAVHAQRLLPQDARERWPAALRQALQQRRAALEQAWSQARQGSDAEQAVAALAATLQDTVWQVLQAGSLGGRETGPLRTGS